MTNFAFTTPTGSSVEVSANEHEGFAVHGRGQSFAFFDADIVTNNPALGPHIAIGTKGPKIQIHADDLAALRVWMTAAKAVQMVAKAAFDARVMASLCSVEVSMRDMESRYSVN